MKNYHVIILSLKPEKEDRTFLVENVTKLRKRPGRIEFLRGREVVYDFPYFSTTIVIQVEPSNGPPEYDKPDGGSPIRG